MKSSFLLPKNCAFKKSSCESSQNSCFHPQLLSKRDKSLGLKSTESTLLLTFLLLTFSFWGVGGDEMGGKMRDKRRNKQENELKASAHPGLTAEPR